MKQYMNKTLGYITVSMMVAALASCGDDDKKSISPSVSGTAATGAPIAGTVTAKGANGQESPAVTIGADGSYRVNVAGLTAPFFIVVDPDSSADFFYSYAAAANMVANVTPLTTMALAMAANQNPANLHANWQTAASGLTAEQVQAAAQRVYANLQASFTAQGLNQTQYDFFTARFKADSVDDYDVLLDNLGTVTYNFTGATPAITVNGVAVDTNITLDTMDFDGDGVPAKKDRCLTADHNLSADVDKDGCDDANEDKDDDNDGVLDAADHCATADQVLSDDVDADGCDDADEDEDVVTDETAPKLSQVFAVPANGTDTTPDYTFNSSEAGSIIYEGDCSAAVTTAKAGHNKITFNELSLATHSNCSIIVQDAAGNESTPLAVSSFTIKAPPEPTSCGTGDAVMPVAIKGKTISATYAGTATTQHPNASSAAFNFCNNGSLFVNNQLVNTEFTRTEVNSTTLLLKWTNVQKNSVYEVVVFNGEFHEVNLSTADAATFLGQFTKAAEVWKLVIAGTACVSSPVAFCTPFATETSTVAAPGSLETVKSYYGNYNTPEFKMTVTTLQDTATVKSFKVHYEVNSGGVAQKIDYTYTYTKQ